MKYVMFEVTHGSFTRYLPVIFPDDLVHSDIAENVSNAIAQSFEITKLEINVANAGFINSMDCDVSVYGRSETLNLDSNPEDSLIIKLHDYTHGIL